MNIIIDALVIITCVVAITVYTLSLLGGLS